MGTTFSAARSSWSSSEYEKAYVPPETVKTENDRAVHNNEALDPRVDPKVKPIRESISLPGEVAMDFRVWVDHTGSMGNKIYTIYEALERQNLLLSAQEGPRYLGNYTAHIALALFGDVEDSLGGGGDPHPISITEYENEAVEIVKGIRLLRVDHKGGDGPEDPQLALEFCRSYTRRSSNARGQKGFEFFATDAPGRKKVRVDSLNRVFGKSSIQSDMETEAVTELLREQVFLVALLVEPDPSAIRYWKNLCGSEYVVNVPNEKYLPEISSVIVGLTEGVVTLDEVPRHLMEYAGLDQRSANEIQNAVSAIPYNAQNQDGTDVQTDDDEEPANPDGNDWL